MKTLDELTTNAHTAYRNADKSGKKLLSDLFGAKTFSTKITDRIKTFEDACRELGLNPDKQIPTSNERSNSFHVGIIAFAKLQIIIRALNEGWEPDWSNTDEYKYFPYFTTNKSGVGFSDAAYDYWGAYATVGSRLCFKSSELAEYAGKQFETIYNEFLTL